MDDGSPPEQAGAPDHEPAPDEDPDDEIPPVVLAAMKDRMHARRFSAPDDPSHLRVSLGTADDDLHVVDDGPDHCMIGRPVGHAPDGCVYVLVARLSRYHYEQLRDGDRALAQAFSDARDISLSGVYEVAGTVQNIALVRRFRRGDDIPDEYLPPSPFLEFTDEESPDDEWFDDGSSDDGPSVRAESSDGTGPADGADTADGTGPDGGESAHGGTHGELLIDEDALTDDAAPEGLMRRAFDRTTAAFRRVRPPGGGGRSGFPGI